MISNQKYRHFSLQADVSSSRYRNKMAVGWIPLQMAGLTFSFMFYYNFKPK